MLPTLSPSASRSPYPSTETKAAVQRNQGNGTQKSKSQLLPGRKVQKLHSDSPKGDRAFHRLKNVQNTSNSQTLGRPEMFHRPDAYHHSVTKVRATTPKPTRLTDPKTFKFSSTVQSQSPVARQDIDPQRMPPSDDRPRRLPSSPSLKGVSDVEADIAKITEKFHGIDSTVKYGAQFKTKLGGGSLPPMEAIGNKNASDPTVQADKNKPSSSLPAFLLEVTISDSLSSLHISSKGNNFSEYLLQALHPENFVSVYGRPVVVPTKPVTPAATLSSPATTITATISTSNTNPESSEQAEASHTAQETGNQVDAKSPDDGEWKPSKTDSAHVLAGCGYWPALGWEGLRVQGSNKDDGDSLVQHIISNPQEYAPSLESVTPTPVVYRFANTVPHPSGLPDEVPSEPWIDIKVDEPSVCPRTAAVLKQFRVKDGQKIDEEETRKPVHNLVMMNTSTALLNLDGSEKISKKGRTDTKSEAVDTTGKRSMLPARDLNVVRELDPGTAPKVQPGLLSTSGMPKDASRPASAASTAASLTARSVVSNQAVDAASITQAILAQVTEKLQANPLLATLQGGGQGLQATQNAGDSEIEKILPSVLQMITGVTQQLGKKRAGIRRRYSYSSTGSDDYTEDSRYDSYDEGDSLYDYSDEDDDRGRSRSRSRSRRSRSRGRSRGHRSGRSRSRSHSRSRARSRDRSNDRSDNTNHKDDIKAKEDALQKTGKSKPVQKLAPPTAETPTKSVTTPVPAPPVAPPVKKLRERKSAPPNIGSRPSTANSNDRKGAPVTIDEEEDNQPKALSYLEKKDLFAKCRNNKHKQVEELIVMGYPVDTVDENGNQILHIACQNGNKRMIKVCLRYSANINAKNKEGNTPLHFCFAFNYDQAAAYLISKGADDSVLNNFGMSCYDGLRPEEDGEAADTAAPAQKSV